MFYALQLASTINCRLFALVTSSRCDSRQSVQKKRKQTIYHCVEGEEWEMKGLIRLCTAASRSYANLDPGLTQPTTQKHWMALKQRLQLPATRCSRRRQISPPVPPSGELDQNVRVVFDSAHSLYYVKTWRNPQNRK